jgi:hypothetical protein
MGLLHRVRGKDALKESNERLKEAIEAELATTLPARYGREYLFRHLSMRGIPVARDRMFSILKELDPEGVAAREPAFKANRDRKGKYIVPGPDYVWSVDGHLKFRDYGIGIYAMVDGYSRYITSIYVGLSVTCAVSILKQYLDAVESNNNTRPRFIRSDRGTETILMANAHWQLEEADDPTAVLKSIYRYGTSKANSRIESWWEELTDGQTKSWQVGKEKSNIQRGGANNLNY